MSSVIEGKQAARHIAVHADGGHWPTLLGHIHPCCIGTAGAHARAPTWRNGCTLEDTRVFQVRPGEASNRSPCRFSSYICAPSSAPPGSGGPWHVAERQEKGPDTQGVNDPCCPRSQAPPRGHKHTQEKRRPCAAWHDALHEFSPGTPWAACQTPRATSRSTSSPAEKPPEVSFSGPIRWCAVELPERRRWEHLPSVELLCFLSLKANGFAFAAFSWLPRLEEFLGIITSLPFGTSATYRGIL